MPYATSNGIRLYYEEAGKGTALKFVREFSGVSRNIRRWGMPTPATGHLVNVEEPEFFNRITGDFLALVDGSRWRPRDPRSFSRSQSKA